MNVGKNTTEEKKLKSFLDIYNNPAQYILIFLFYTKINVSLQNLKMSLNINIDTLQSTATLNNGIQIPMFGLGVYLSKDGNEVINAIKWAIEAGYRLIDTASFYENEAGVGQGVKESAAAREDIFVTTKVWNTDQGYDATLKAFDESFDKLGLDYVDLYLVHWPVSGKYKETYRALEKLYKEGRVKAIGVSNFLTHHLDDLLQSCTVVPTVNQIEFHPYLVQQELLDYCQSHNILPQAWSPLMQGRIFDVPEIVALSQAYGKTPVQLVLRWSLQKGVATIPKSSKQQRIIDNAHIYDFEISESDIAKIDALDRDQRFGPHPNDF